MDHNTMLSYLMAQRRGGGSSGGGGVGVAPQMDHGYGYLSFTVYEDATIGAGSSHSMIELTGYDQSTIVDNNANNGYGYIYGHPEITARKEYDFKHGQFLDTTWNSSATDFTFKAGETYTLVFLYHG